MTETKPWWQARNEEIGADSASKQTTGHRKPTESKSRRGQTFTPPDYTDVVTMTDHASPVHNVARDI